ncbi:DivIVA domain protein [Halobacteroides halobius DSM 5150]|uniref:DivIVA domain protein n=1 Tax=Halobacteroides halobius (strain ATCC 35273 / DSM 5150 / MD-1) TaxID=748449 RepID=L0K8G4_HALHC|nr:DivIVA domain-containing protein [Halobacteroides halobius]AGB40820.1 DivIVA domain protein [Halobacteroides halobius DSM 5150]
MSLNPEDIYNKEFNKTFGLWSYDDQEVIEFLDLVATYYEEVLEENTRLEKRVKELEKEVDRCKQEQIALQESVQETINTAKKTASSKKEEAERKAELIIEEAEIKADKIIKDAQDKAQEEYQQYKELIQSKKLFKIKFKTLLNSYLELLDDEEVELEIIKDKMKGE